MPPPIIVRRSGRPTAQCALFAPALLESLEPRSLLSISPADAPEPVFRAAADAPIEVLKTVDIDLDGDNDLVFNAGSRIIVLRNRGDGTFSAPLRTELPDGMPRRPSTIRVLNIETGDFDGDGDIDVAAAGTAKGPGGQIYARTWLLTADPTGRLTPAGITRSIELLYGQGSLFKLDVDGDGTTELVTRTLHAYGFVNGRITDKGVINDGNWSASGEFDVDADGDSDLLAYAGSSFIPTLLRNNGHGFDAEALPFIGSLQDLNGDGLPEMVESASEVQGDGAHLVLRAVLNTAGRFDTPAVTLYDESFTSLRARGGHGPEVPQFYAYGVRARISTISQQAGDERLDLLVTITSSQYWDYRPTGPTNEFDFSERYGVLLTASGPDLPSELPTYTAQDADPASEEQSPPFVTGQAALVDLDGDDIADRVLLRDPTTVPTYPYVKGSRLIYTDLSTARRPLITSARFPGRPNVARAGTLTASVSITPPADGSVTQVDMFIDSNQNGRPDAADRRLGAATFDAEAGTWNFSLRRRPAWGQGVNTFFVLASSGDGTVGVPVATRLRLP